MELGSFGVVIDEADVIVEGPLDYGVMCEVVIREAFLGDDEPFEPEFFFFDALHTGDEFAVTFGGEHIPYVFGLVVGFRVR